MLDRRAVTQRKDLADLESVKRSRLAIEIEAQRAEQPGSQAYRNSLSSAESGLVTRTASPPIPG